MILSISEQVIVFLWTTVCGMIIAFVYDIFRIFRKAVKTGSLVTFVQDLLFWLIACIIMFLSIFQSNDGELRGFLFLGAFLGAVLYALLLSRAVMGSSLFIINIMVKVVKFLAFVLLYPFRFLLRLMAKPLSAAAKAAARSLRKVRIRKKIKSGRRSIFKKIPGILANMLWSKLLRKRTNKHRNAGKSDDLQQ